MNVRDDMRCEWASAGMDGFTRCACPATLSTSKFCVFHRRADAVDAPGIVAWSQDATPEEYLERARAMVYAHPSPAVQELRRRIDTGARRARQAVHREPGEDPVEEAA